MFDYNKETDIIVFIQYQNKLPFSVITTSKDFKGLSNFDFEPDCKELEKFMFYCSGGGGNIKDIYIDDYIKSYKGGSYWIHKNAKERNTPINNKKLKNPLKINGDTNPFNNGRQIRGTEYCDICEKWYDEDACDEHQEFSDSGTLCYKNKGSN